MSRTVTHALQAIVLAADRQRADVELGEPLRGLLDGVVLTVQAAPGSERNRGRAGSPGLGDSLYPLAATAATTSRITAWRSTTTPRRMCVVRRGRDPRPPRRSRACPSSTVDLRGFTISALSRSTGVPGAAFNGDQGAGADRHAAAEVCDAGDRFVVRVAYAACRRPWWTPTSPTRAGWSSGRRRHRGRSAQGSAGSSSQAKRQRPATRRRLRLRDHRGPRARPPVVRQRRAATPGDVAAADDLALAEDHRMAPYRGHRDQRRLRRSRSAARRTGCTSTTLVDPRTDGTNLRARAARSWACLLPTATAPIGVRRRGRDRGPRRRDVGYVARDADQAELRRGERGRPGRRLRHRSYTRANQAGSATPIALTDWVDIWLHEGFEPPGRRAIGTTRHGGLTAQETFDEVYAQRGGRRRVELRRRSARFEGHDPGSADFGPVYDRGALRCRHPCARRSATTPSSDHPAHVVRRVTR